MKDEAFLGIELGSTRIKAALIDGAFREIDTRDYTWESGFINGVWTYDLEEAFAGIRAALTGLKQRERVCAVGVSAMMHGYLAFDRDWNLLVPFRTWQNTLTGPAAAALTEAFHFNIPQRWSIAHLYQAVLNGEPHVSRIAHITTLAGYVHFCLTGVNALGIGDASGVFPIDSDALAYDEGMLNTFDEMLLDRKLPWRIRELLPEVLPAGAAAGKLSRAGAALLQGLLPEGTPFCPPEGDAGTGMTATNAVAPRTGNVSAGTSVFSMVVLEKPLHKVYPEIDLVTTPSGRPVAMVHCTNDFNAWASLLSEAAELFGEGPEKNRLFTRLYQKSLAGDPDCGGVLVCNYLAGEGVTHFDKGLPLVLRKPGASFTLANFLRASLYSALATLQIGMELLKEEGVAVDSLTGHGGLFKTPPVGQRYLAAACDAPITCREGAGEGGAFGAALLAAFCLKRAPGETLEDYLAKRVFKDAASVTVLPDKADRDGFSAYLKAFRELLGVERAAVLHI